MGRRAFKELNAFLESNGICFIDATLMDEGVGSLGCEGSVGLSSILISKVSVYAKPAWSVTSTAISLFSLMNF